MNVAIFGAGYVGLVTGACLAGLDHDVTCIDVVKERVDAINAGKTPIFEVGLEELLHRVTASGRFRATLDANGALAKADVSMIAVGTPARDGKIDLSFVETVATTIGSHLKARSSRHTVIVKSTVVPGTTNGVVRNAVERASGKTAGKDFGLAMNPEFLREGCAVDDFMTPDRIVIGQLDDASGNDVAKLYEKFDCPKVRTGLANAELIKYASNTLLATLVSFSNELYAICENTDGADGETIMDGLALDRRLSPILHGDRIHPQILGYLRGGIGYGGSCLPKDVTALRHYAKEKGLRTPLYDAVGEVNALRPATVVAILERTLGGVKGRTIGIMGVAFKPDTDDLRDSPALPLIQALRDRGARLRVLDPQARLDGSEMVETPDDLCRNADALLLATSWPAFKTWDYARLLRTMRQPVVVDGRNALRHVAWPDGTRYIPVGRGP